MHSLKFLSKEQLFIVTISEGVLFGVWIVSTQDTIGHWSSDTTVCTWSVFCNYQYIGQEASDLKAKTRHLIIASWDSSNPQDLHHRGRHLTSRKFLIKLCSNKGLGRENCCGITAHYAAADLWIFIELKSLQETKTWWILWLISREWTCMFVLGEEQRGALHNKIDSQESSSKIKLSSEISVPFCKISLHSWTAKWKLCFQ